MYIFVPCVGLGEIPERKRGKRKGGKVGDGVKGREFEIFHIKP